MAFEEMIVAIVFVSIVGSIVSRAIKSKERIAIARAEGSAEKGSSLYTELEERVQVLERIVTDKRERLKEEIDAL